MQENDATTGNKDVLRFGTSIDAAQVWLRKINNDLGLSLIGAGDRVTVAGWYTGQLAHAEEIYAGGKKLRAAGETSLPANLQTATENSGGGKLDCGLSGGATGLGPT